MISEKKLNNIPNITGVYLFKNKFDEVIYVGKALDIKKRVISHLQNQITEKDTHLVNEVKDIEVIKVPSEVEALILEANLIRKYQPKYNTKLRDSKSFIYIVISDEEYPRVLASRKNNNQIPVKYNFGPYPSTKTVRQVLKLLRKIFPYCQQSPNIKKPCFYSHLGLCNPCPVIIKKEKGRKQKILKKVYLQNINNIRKILEGKITTVNQKLNKLICKFSSEQKFEEAKKIYQKLQQLEYITKPYYKVGFFLEESNFLENERKRGVEELANLLKPYFGDLTLNRIEGIDVSNIMGSFASGSLTVFINGEKQPSLYKRFKIKLKDINDILMIQEVLKRRLKHQEWDYPDLFVIDGGKPQVNSARKILINFGNIPVIGLAKRLETIIVPYNSDFVTMSLKRDSQSLRLIQEIRDESHRFAQKYHQLLRRKFITYKV